MYKLTYSILKDLCLKLNTILFLSLTYNKPIKIINTTRVLLIYRSLYKIEIKRTYTSII